MTENEIAAKVLDAAFNGLDDTPHVAALRRCERPLLPNPDRNSAGLH